MSEATCPICNMFPTALPNGVCVKCYEHQKRLTVHSRDYIEKQEKQRGGHGKYPYSDEVFQHNVNVCMKSEAEEWESMTKNGLSAPYLATMIIDEDQNHDEEEFGWLKREAFFLCDLILALPGGLFAPVTHEQMEIYIQKATDYWNGLYNDEQRKTILKDFEALLDKQTSGSTWDAKSLPLWLMELPDVDLFDWMLSQFMDCVWSCVPAGELSDAQWMALFRKHFSHELANRVKDN